MRVKIITHYPTYIVTDDGKVFNRFRGNQLKSNLNSKGYPRVWLYKNGRDDPKAVHRLVAEAFLRKRPRCKELNHKNGIKTDNRLENLEWCTRLQNVRHYHKNLRG